MIKYLVGDATNPEKREDETVVVAHVVNDVGAWGRGFVVALSKQDDGPERAYRRWHAEGVDNRETPFALGHVSIVAFQPSPRKLWVANMVAQRGWRRGGSDPQALDPQALQSCLRALYGELVEPFDKPTARVVMPRIGCGLGGAKWSDIAPIIEHELVERGVDVTVYSMPDSFWEDN